MKERVAARPRTLKELCAIYQVSASVMRRQIAIAGLGRRRGGYYYTIRELQAIVEAIGEPEGEEDG